MILFDPNEPTPVDGGPGVDALVETSRRSIVAVIAPGRGGSGFVALANGVVVTTHDAVGFDPDATIALDDDRTAAARVVAVDVARNVALLLPEQPLGLPALRPAPAESAKLGARYVAIARPRPGELRAADGVVSGERRGASGDWLRTSVALGAPGAAVLDRDGRVIGVGCGEPREPEPHTGTGGLVAPLRLFDDLLRAVDLPPGQVASQKPVYRCPGCARPFDVEDDRCLGCGAPLPHAHEQDGPGGDVERIVRELLAKIGVGANRVRSGARSWRFTVRSPGTSSASQIVLRVDRAGRTASLRAPLARIGATAAHEPIHRLLLTLDDASTADARLALGPGAVVFLALTVLVRELAFASAGDRVAKLARDADHFRALLGQAFDLEPLREASDPEPA
jgi:hypothetical protein